MYCTIVYVANLVKVIFSVLGFAGNVFIFRLPGSGVRTLTSEYNRFRWKILRRHRFPAPEENYTTVRRDLSADF